MQNGYYIYCSSKICYTGVDKKVDSQIKVFEQYFCCDKVMVEREEYNMIKSILWRFPFASFGRRYNEVYGIIQNPDFIYIRFVPVDKKFLHFIKTLRERFPLCKILLEVPTYPYKRELLGSLTMFPFFFKDELYRMKLKKYVDRIVTYTKDNKIFDISTIRIMNGICLKNVKIAQGLKKNDKIILLAVANFQKYHGYERCLKGLKDYYNKRMSRIIEFHMVGVGEELNYYRALVKRYHLERYVIFYGRKTGEELDELYDMADIAMGSFGFYKIKLERSSNLKIREYLAKGLPIISGCVEDIFEYDDSSFFYKFPNDKTPLNMEKIIEFYDNVYGKDKERKDVRERIREYANKTIDMQVVMQPVIEYLLTD